MKQLSKWKISAYLAAIFLAGAIAGAFVGFQAGQHLMFRPPRPETMAARASDELQARLNLTPEQMRKIKPLINDAMVQFQTLVGREISAAISNCNARIAVELTPEQQVKLSELQKEREKFLNNPFKGAPEPPPKTP